MPVRALLSSIGFTFSLVFSTQGVVNTFGDLRRATVALDKIRAVLREPQPQHARADQPAGTSAATADCERIQSAREATSSGDIELRGLSFEYPMRPGARVIDDVSLVLPRGKVTALVGRSGAGKSSIAVSAFSFLQSALGLLPGAKSALPGTGTPRPLNVNRLLLLQSLLVRFYEPTSGAVLVGGQDAREFDLDDWHSAVSLVSQEPVLFTGTVFENIAYGRAGQRCSRDEVEAAAKAANAHEFIERLPQGYDTFLGSRGLAVSSSQLVAAVQVYSQDCRRASIDQRPSRHGTNSQGTGALPAPVVPMVLPFTFSPPCSSPEASGSGLRSHGP